MLNQDMMREATRLTRAGQLAEATLLLQRMLRGESPPDATWRTGRIAPAGRQPPILDAVANTIEETDGPRPAQATPVRPRMFGELFDRRRQRSPLGLRGVSRRAPPSTPDMVPEGARFIEGT